MKARLVIFLLCVALHVVAQDLEVPTLESKGIQGKVKSIEWYQYQFVNNQGLTYVKKDVEQYDDEGRLSSILSFNVSNNQQYKYVYTLDKKGLLTEMKIVNPANNLALQTTTYDYKKGLVEKTTQVQGPNTVEKVYEYDNKDHLISVEVKQNGTLQLTEYYEVDDEGRRIQLSRKMTNEENASIISTYSYEVREGQRITIEKRNTDQGEYEITKYTDLSNERDLLEETKKVSTGQKGHQNQLFVDDERGNWIKAEVLDEQFGRSRLVIRKIIYADGTETGRTEMESAKDDRGQFIRKYSQMQLAVNGKIASNGAAYDIPNSKDRLTYVASTKSWYLLKGYDDNSNMTSWGEAELVTAEPNAIVYTSAGSSGINVYRNGIKLTSGTTTYSNYSSYDIGTSTVAYVRGNDNKTFVAEHLDKLEKGVGIAELTNESYYWGKVTDSTYILTAFGRSIGIEKQFEDKSGNKLTYNYTGGVYYWHALPEFRKHFSEGQPSDIFPADYLISPLKEIKEKKLIDVDLSAYQYDRLANGNYRLKSKDGQTITAIASKSVKTPDDQLLVYFPLTRQYLRMDGFYQLEKEKEHLGQNVTVLIDSATYAYYMYNEGKSIVFYKPGERITKQQFNAHKLDNNRNVYGALVYDSLENRSFGMRYDLDQPVTMGEMQKLPYTTDNVYLLKLEANRWVIFRKGEKLGNYDFSKLRNDNKEVVHFYKDETEKTRAYQFPGFDEAEPGDFIYAYQLRDNEINEVLTELGIDRELKVEENDDGVDLGRLEYDKSEEVFYLTDANGTYIQNRLSWFSSFDTDHMIAYDSVGHFLYEMTGYKKEETIQHGKVRVLINDQENAVIHWGDNKAMLAVNGEFRNNVNRVYVTQNASDLVWSELIYDGLSGETYQFDYPNDSTFKVLKTIKLPKNNDAAYLIKIGEKSFNLVAKGELVRDENAKSYNYQGDLVRFHTTETGVLTAYRFKGFAEAKDLAVLPAEIVPTDQVRQLAEDIGKSGN